MIEEELQHAEAICLKAGEKFTPLRKRVLELLLKTHGQMGAYDLLKHMGDGAKPPTVYRTLDFLVRLGLVHRIESTNTFVACTIGGCHRARAFLLCTECGEVDEINAEEPMRLIKELAGEQEFQINVGVLELSGICHSCTSSPATH